MDKQHALAHLIITDVVLLWIHAGDYKTCKSEKGWDLSEHRTDFSPLPCSASRSGSFVAVRKTNCCGLAFFTGAAFSDLSTLRPGFKKVRLQSMWTIGQNDAHRVRLHPEVFPCGRPLCVSPTLVETVQQCKLPQSRFSGSSSVSRSLKLRLLNTDMKVFCILQPSVCLLMCTSSQRGAAALPEGSHLTQGTRV